MDFWIKGISGFLVGGMFLYFQPWLESTQNSTTYSLGLTGQVVVLVWLGLTFLWASVGALIGHSTAAVGVFYLRARNEAKSTSSSRLTDEPDD